MQQLKVGDISLCWLRGGAINLDGGAMFGVVPKPLWSKEYPVNEKNQIPQFTSPIYLELAGKKVVIDTGIGKGKLTDKQKRNFGCTEESNIADSLAELGTKLEEIDYVLLTHMHFDHACGLTFPEGDNYRSSFPNAQIIMSQQEWEETKKPNIRSVNTYWKQNWEPIASQVVTFKEELEVLPGLTIQRTGGHSHGHSIIVIKRGQDTAIHMGDLMATHVHRPTLWVMAYDDYPIESIHFKENIWKQWTEFEPWFTFYHDSFYYAIKWDVRGDIKDYLKR